MITLLHIALLSSFALFLVPKRAIYITTLVLQLMVVVATGSWAIEAFLGTEVVVVPLGISTWSGEITMTIDKLSALFILIVNFICLSGMVYAGGYLRPYIQKKRAVIISLHLFSFLWLNAAMVLVTAMEDGLSFLLAWELMSLTSFILVIFEGEKESTLKTGINYLLQMHLGFALIMFGFLMVHAATGEMSFKALGTYFANHSNTIVYFTFFAGFGIKAGFIPLHTWLPRAHPAAPAHVSGVMSGVMIKMGIYGILRVSSFLTADQKFIGSVVLVVGIVSGLIGVILAIMQHDLKRLLAYHSVENIGIIGIGIGLSILGMATHDNNLAALGMAGALLHCINHALFKSLLFFTSGNVHHATGTVNMDELGGIVGGLRATSLAFLVGAIAISGIPPFNGFISEFLIYKGLALNFTNASFGMSLAGLTALLALVLIGGLCLYCFTKAFGLTFLGTRRSLHPAELKPVSTMMILPLLLIGVAITFIGIFPVLILEPLVGALSGFASLDNPAASLRTAETALRTVGLTNVLLLALVSAIAVIRMWQLAKARRRMGPTWGCGYSAGDFRHQYTPTSYADAIVEIAGPTIIHRKDYKAMEEAEVFPVPRRFHTHAGDRVEQSAVTTLIGLLITYLPMAGRAQTGMIHHYLLYPVLFMVLIVLITYLNYI